MSSKKLRKRLKAKVRKPLKRRSIIPEVMDDEEEEQYPVVRFTNPNEKVSGKEGGLTYKNRLLIDAYFGKAKFNQVEAYRMAGYKSKSPEVATAGATNIFRRAKVQREIARRWAKMQSNKAASMSEERLIEELENIVLFDFRTFFTPDGTLKPIQQLSAVEARQIRSLRTLQVGDRGSLQELKRDDRLKALELLMRAKGMLVERRIDETPRGGTLQFNVIIERD